MDIRRLLQIQAHANRLANRRLAAALSRLAPDAFHAPRTGFFPSLSATLNHILAVDAFYIGALHGGTDLAGAYQRFVAAADVAAWDLRQQASDGRLIAFCDRLGPHGCDTVVVMDRGAGEVQRELAGHVLAHLFMHQTHHRGQAHAMLSGTAVEPPQLDEFIMPSDAPLRIADMAALGWREIDVYGAAAR